MRPGTALGRGVVVIVAAFILDMALGPRIAIAGARPDLTMAALVPVALWIGDGSAAWLGLLAGSLLGAFGSVGLGSLAVSRALAAWCTGMVERRLFRDSLLVASAAGFGALAVAELTFFAFSPQPDAVAYLAGALGRAVYNMVLVVPLTILLRPLFRPPV